MSAYLFGAAFGLFAVLVHVLVSSRGPSTIKRLRRFKPTQSTSKGFASSMAARLTEANFSFVRASKSSKSRAKRLSTTTFACLSTAKSLPFRA